MVVLDPPSVVPVTAGTAVHLTAHVLPTLARGSVRFFDGQSPIAEPVPVVGGVARLATAALVPGPHALTASFIPDTADVAASASTPEALVVRTAAATVVPRVTLSVSPSRRVAAGTSLTLSATVGPAGARGTVDFLADGAPLGPSVPLSGGVATMRTAAVRVGSHKIVAQFTPADEGWVPSSSAWTALAVTAPPSGRSATGLTIATQGGMRVRSPLTITATVFPTGRPGSVTFFDGSAALADPVAVIDGQADLSLPGLSAGRHRISAAFSPDSAALRPSTSATNDLDVVSGPVGARTTVTTLTVSPATTRAGAPLTVTATVSGAVSGRLVLLDLGQLVGGGRVVAGRWSDTLSLPVGAHRLTARFTADDAAAASDSASAPVPVTVVRSPATVTTAALTTGAAGVVTSGKPLTVTATVTPGDALGSVTLLDRGRPIALATVAAGQASFTIPSVGTGTHDYTARFTSANPRYWTAASTPVTRVSARSVTTTSAPPTTAPGASVAPTPTASPEISAVALESGIPTAAGSNLGIVKSGADAADLVAIAVVSLLLGFGLLVVSGASRRRRAVAPPTRGTSHPRHAG